MTWNTIAGAASTMALFLPVLIILFCRLFQNGSLLTLLLYYLLAGLFSLMNTGMIAVSAPAARLAASIYNYMDIPIMLVVLLFFCAEKWKQQTIYLTLALFILFEIGVAFFYGLQPQSNVYILGPGTLVVLLYSIYFFMHYGKISIVQGKSIGRTLMAVAVLFSYGSFGMIYFLFYIQKTSAVADVFLIYYIVNFISAVLMSIGLLWIYKRIRSLKEIQNTRRELAAFFEY